MIIRAELTVITSCLLLLCGQAFADEETFLNVLLPGSAGAISTKDNEDYWQLVCQVDAMDDGRSCSIRYYFSSYELGDFWTSVGQGNRIDLIVAGGSSAYPKSKKILRVDSNKAHQTDESVPFAGTKELLSEIRAGSILRTRWRDWPYNYEQDKEQPLKGYGEALDLAIKVVDEERFSLPPGSIEYLYYWEGVGLRRVREDVRAALKSKHFAKECAFEFDPDQRVEEILASIPGLAGQALRKGYAREPASSLPNKCAENGARLARDIVMIPNLIYPD